MSNRLKKATPKKSTPAYSNTGTGKNYLLIPLFILIAVVPLIMKLYIYDSGLSKYGWFADTNSSVDIFLHSKAVMVIFLAVTMAFILVVKRIMGSMPSLKKEYWLFFLLGYGALTFLSTVCSEYRSFGFSGIYEQFESVWVILSYCMITFYTFVVFRTKEDIKPIKIAFLILLAAISFIGLSQFFGHDFFESTLGKALIIPSEHANLRDQLSFSFSGSANNAVYLTLYNPNYVGVFTALLLPITLIFIPFSKNALAKAAWGVLSILLLVCAFGSGSKAFLIALVGIAFVAVIICRKYFLKHYLLVLITVCTFVIIVRAAFAYMGISPIDYVKNALTLKEVSYPLNDIDITEDSVKVVYNNETLQVKCTNSSGFVFLEFYDENGNVIESTTGDNNITRLTDERFSSFSFSLYSGQNVFPYVVGMRIDNAEFLFTNIEGEGYTYVTHHFEADMLIDSPSAFPNKYNRLMSGRGFIWSKSIPLLKDSIILGSGADSFSLVFPNSDYVDRTNAGYGDILITKPHSLYLQIAIQHGIPAFICFIVVCAWYLLQSLKLYWKTDFSNKFHLLGIALMLGVIGYLILGITNDSSITCAPLFWMALGLGYAVNRINKEDVVK
ncbi:MAG: O-antigen ligase family protein [Lachnospiraceae bacterium]|nr:O-antigen ligase family protein [Lachnospiraceae bacterium]